MLPQRLQRTRGTKIRSSPASRRWRRYPDQRSVGPPQRGQLTRGGSTSRPRAAYVLTSSRQGYTITDGGPSLHHDPPRARYPRGVTWFVPVQIILLRATRCRRPHSARPSPAGSCPYRHAANNWLHIRTSNAIESVFAGVRLRTNVTKRARVRENALYLVFKIVERLGQHWRTLSGGATLMALVLDGETFVDGIFVRRPAAAEVRAA